MRWRTTHDPSNLAVQFLARDIRLTNTGLHAFVAIKVADSQIGHTTFNVDRDEERVRFINSCHRQSGLGEKFPATALKRMMDAFCLGLRAERTGHIKVEQLAGSRDLKGVPPVLSPWIYQGAGTILYAPGGAGKSGTGLAMAVCIDAGIEYNPFGYVPEAGPVLFVNIERSARSMQNRLARVNYALGLSEERTLSFVNARGKTFGDVADIVGEAIRKEGYMLIVLDSLSRTGFGELNKDDTANRIIDALNAFGPAWLGIGHTPRDNDSHPFGSVHFENGGDVLVRLSSEKDERNGDLGIGLEVTKANDIRFPKPVFVKFEFDEGGLSAIKAAGSNEFARLSFGTMSAEAKVREYLLRNGTGNPTEMADALDLNHATVRGILRSNDFVRLPKDGKLQPYAMKAPSVDPNASNMLGNTSGAFESGARPNTSRHIDQHIGNIGPFESETPTEGTKAAQNLSNKQVEVGDASALAVGALSIHPPVNSNKISPNTSSQGETVICGGCGREAVLSGYDPSSTIDAPVPLCAACLQEVAS